MKALRSQGVNGELRTCGEMEGSYGVARIALVARETLTTYRKTEKFVEFSKLTHVISRAHTKICGKRLPLVL
jgi:hypothetical protein